MKNLKKLRESRGMSQQKLADELFITQQSIYKYENDLAYPNLETLKMMSKFFSVSIDYIVDNEQNNISPRIANSLTDDERTVLEYYRKLPPDLQKNVQTLLKHLG